MDWYNDLVRGATASLSKMFDPNYDAVRASMLPRNYSDSQGMSLQQMFDYKNPRMTEINKQDPAMGEDGWEVNRHPAPVIKRVPYKGML